MTEQQTAWPSHYTSADVAMTNDRMMAPLFHGGVWFISPVGLEWGVAEGLLDSS